LASGSRYRITVPEKLSPKMKEAEIARLEAMRRASVRMGPGYADRIREIDAKLKAMRDG